jgi:ABC-type phosphate transport system ATPase subunit
MKSGQNCAGRTGNRACGRAGEDVQQHPSPAQQTAFIDPGSLAEVGATTDIFTNPREEPTKYYITGYHG